MQNTESNYLIKLKIAIDKAKHLSFAAESLAGTKAREGWDQAIADMSYASECGEIASKQHIEIWLTPEEIAFDDIDRGYFGCINFIEMEMNK